MDQAELWCRSRGYSHVDNVSRQRSWDLEARRRRNSSRVLYVEAKGTIGSRAVVEITDAELTHARAHPDDTALVVVTDIHLDRRSVPPAATGGTVRSFHPWKPDPAELTPIRYRWTAP